MYNTVKLVFFILITFCTQQAYQTSQAFSNYENRNFEKSSTMNLDHLKRQIQKNKGYQHQHYQNSPKTILKSMKNLPYYNQKNNIYDIIINDVVNQLKTILFQNNYQDPTEDTFVQSEPNQLLILVLQKLIHDVGGCEKILNLIGEYTGPVTNSQGNLKFSTEKRLLNFILHQYFRELGGCVNLMNHVLKRQYNYNDSFGRRSVSDLNSNWLINYAVDETEDDIKNSTQKRKVEEEIYSKQDETADS
jgi:hypothetical protein